MKSAKELAMEKLGIGKGAGLTDAQKREIAEIRQKAKAKKAEEEIMIQGKMAAMPDGEEKNIFKEESARLIRKIERNAEDKIEAVRSKKR